MPTGIPNSKIIYAEKLCPICKKTYRPTGKNQIYCSQSCAHDALRLKPHKTPKAPKPQRQTHETVCLWCKAKIKSYAKTTLYCSTDCREEYHRLNHIIREKYYFEHEKCDLELGRLKVLGKDYKIEVD